MTDMPAYDNSTPPAYDPSGAPQRQGVSGLAIGGFVLSFFGILAIAGLIMSIIAFRHAPRQGRPRGLALAGIIVSSVVIVLSIAGGVAIGVGLAHVVSECKQLGPGTHQVGGVTYTCS